MQHAGVRQVAHDRQQRIEPGVLLAYPAAPAGQQLRQALLDHGRKAVLRLFPRAEHAVAPADPRAMAVGVVRRGRIAQPGQCRRGIGDASSVWCISFQSRRRAEQPQRPNRAAMGVDSAGDAQHLRLTFTAQSAEGFAQRLADSTKHLCCFSHRLEGWPQSIGRSVHQTQMQVVVRAIAAPVHQSRLG